MNTFMLLRSEIEFSYLNIYDCEIFPYSISNLSIELHSTSLVFQIYLPQFQRIPTFISLPFSLSRLAVWLLSLIWSTTYLLGKYKPFTSKNFRYKISSLERSLQAIVLKNLLMYLHFQVNSQKPILSTG